MDLDSPLYKSVRVQMMEMMKPVISFCNALKNEREGNNKDRPLEEFLNEAKKERFETIAESAFAASFSAPKPRLVRVKAQEAKITYARPTEMVDAIKAKFSLDSVQKVGEMTFDYFYKREIEE